MADGFFPFVCIVALSVALGAFAASYFDRRVVIGIPSVPLFVALILGLFGYWPVWIGSDTPVNPTLSERLEMASTMCWGLSAIVAPYLLGSAVILTRDFISWGGRYRWSARSYFDSLNESQRDRGHE